MWFTSPETIQLNSLILEKWFSKEVIGLKDYNLIKNLNIELTEIFLSRF